MKKKKPPGRSSKSISSTHKELRSIEQIEHLDPFSKRHEHDVKQTAIQRAKSQNRKSQSDISDKNLQGALKASGLPPLDEKENPISDYDSLKPILDLRDNLCLEDGKWTQKKGPNWNAFITRMLKNRSTYKEASGSIRKTGQLKYKSPLKMVFCRLPPWLASEINASPEDESLIKNAVQKLAETFSEQTGYPIIAANIHKESKHDLHVHIVYSDVVEVHLQKKMTKKKQREFLAQIRNDVREQLKADGLPAHSSNVKAKMDSMDIDFPEHEAFGGAEYRKIMRFSDSKENWPKARRKMHILGSAYRYKGQIWEAAESQEDKESIRLFNERDPDFDGSFTKRLCLHESPEEDYLDWWIEHEFFRKVFSQLDETRKNRVNTNKRHAVNNYLQYGKSVLDPAEAVLLDQSKELKKQQKSLREKEKSVKTKESKLKKEENDLAQKKASLKGSITHYNKQVIKFKAALQTLKKKDRAIKERESLITTKEAALKGREGKLVENEEKLINQGRQDILDQVTVILDPKAEVGKA